jgi:hypothetical protein
VFNPREQLWRLGGEAGNLTQEVIERLVFCLHWCELSDFNPNLMHLMAAGAAHTRQGPTTTSSRRTNFPENTAKITLAFLRAHGDKPLHEYVERIIPNQRAFHQQMAVNSNKR